MIAAVKNPFPARIVVLSLAGVLAVPAFAQHRSNSQPSWAAMTPGSIRAAGSPSGPMPPRVGARPGGHSGRRHHRQGVVGFGWGVPYAIPYDYYYPEPQQPEQPAQPAVSAEPDRSSRTLFEHDGRPMEYQQPMPAREPEQPAPQVQAPPQDEKPGPPTILVFRDGRQQEIQNYAILGDKLIILSDERTKRIALADLDLDATAKANEEQGVDFRLPGKS